VGARSLGLSLGLLGALLISGCGAKKLANQGESLLAEGRTTHAARAYRKACEKRPSKASFHLGYARALLADGQADVAVDPARRAHEAEAEGADLVLIQALVGAGQVDEARMLLERARQDYDDSPEVLDLVVAEHMARGEHRQAVVAAKKVAQAEPSAERVASLAWILARVGEMDRAVETAEEALAMNSEDLDALGDIAAVFLLARLEEQRKQVARDIQSFGAERIDRWSEHAGRAQKAGDHEGALRAMTIAVALRPDRGEGLGMLGQMYLAEDRYELAVHFLGRALEASEYRDSWQQAQAFDEAGAVRTMGFENEAAASFSRSLASAYERLGRHSEAAGALRASVLIGGVEDPDVWVDIARLFAHGDQLRSALHAAHQAHSIDSTHPDALQLLMKLYAGLGDAHQAIGFGRLAWSAMPGDPLVALTLGDLYERRGDLRGAQQVYAVALEKHPEVRALHTAMKRVSR
jgi:tetratricopeptide (TPR) repeat protein